MIRAHRLLLFLLACIFAVSAAIVTEAQEIPASTYQGLRWRNIGPFRGGRAGSARSRVAALGQELA